MLTCRYIIGFLADYLAGDLSPVERATFDAHLAECPDCCKYLHSYEETIRVGKAAMRNFENDANNPLPEALIAAILAARPQKHGSR
jgi:anti-sigma factor RsiW